MQGYTKVQVVWLLLLMSSSSSWHSVHGGESDDVQCLKDLKQSLVDPKGTLESWVFTKHNIDGYICEFTGVECWHPDESRVLGLSLGNQGLEGPFPRGVELCGSMTTLDLSGNKLAGPLPERISDQLAYITYLDLSNNSFSGEIPAGIAKMTYLNTLALQHNQFDGRIPALGNLSRLVSFSVAENSLSGPVPDSLQRFPLANFTGNPRLCGPPIGKKCKKRFRLRIHVRPIRIHLRLRRINDASCIGAAAGFVVGFVVAFYFPHRFLFCRRLRPYIFHVCE
uniref:Uncharacterized protein n=1 Tax=Avena sativa TaxID=4498 RepID=A0ACD5VW00_AVESA